MRPPALLRPYLLVLTAAFLWGTIGVVGKALYGLGQVSPLALGMFRLVVAAPLLRLLSWRLDRGQSWRFGRGEGRWWLLAMTSMGAYQLFLFSAVRRTDVTTAIFLAICTAPILVALAAPFVLGERLTRTALAAGGLALAGTTLVLGFSDPGAMLASGKLVGNLLALGAAVCWATYAIVARHLVQHHSPTRITFFTFAGAALLVAPLVVWQDQPVSLPPAGWALAIYLGVFPTALAYFLYVRGLRTVGATTSSFLALAEPGTAAILAALLFDEQLSGGGWLGVGLLLAGLALLILRSQKHREPPG
ncbi:MAG: EamA family transporter [Caldilineales bacterium]|nr:EamA family transporter [Caldilineales bacterium]